MPHWVWDKNLIQRSCKNPPNTSETNVSSKTRHNYSHLGALKAHNFPQMGVTITHVYCNFTSVQDLYFPADKLRDSRWSKFPWQWIKKGSNPNEMHMKTPLKYFVCAKNLGCSADRLDILATVSKMEQAMHRKEGISADLMHLIGKIKPFCHSDQELSSTSWNIMQMNNNAISDKLTWQNRNKVTNFLSTRKHNLMPYSLELLPAK